jgi:hypothetical protein
MRPKFNKEIQWAHCKEIQPTFRRFSNHAATTPLTAIAQTTVTPLDKSNQAGSNSPMT